MTVQAILILLLAHYLGDFIFQSHKMGVDKWNNIRILAQYALTYTLVFFLTTFVFLVPITDVNSWGIFLVAAIINGLAHFSIDFVTSKINHHLWEKKQFGKFWKTIGLDQLLHYIVIMVIYGYVYSIIS